MPTPLPPPTGAASRWWWRGRPTAAVLSLDPLVVLDDGRAGADENWFESTGIARSTGGTPTLTADPGGSHDLTTSLSPAPGVGPSPPSEEDTHAQGPAAH